MVNKALVAGKLESLMRCVMRIEDKRPPSLAALQEDLDIQDIMVVNLERAVGFRNIALHQYEKIDWAVVFAIAWKHIDDFRAFSGYMANTLIDER